MRLRFVRLLGVLVPVILPPWADAQTPPPPTEVRVVGTATKNVDPDLAIITLEFNAEGPTPAEAGRRLALRADSIRRALQALGIPRDSLVSGSMWNWGGSRIEKAYSTRIVTVPNGPPGATWQKQDTLYRAKDVILARVRDLTKLGAVLDTAFAHDILQVPNPNYAATNTAASRLEMLRLATQDARAQASAMAEASGAKLGRLVSLSTTGDGRGGLEDLLMSRDATTMASAGTQIIKPQLTLSATVYARWELIEAAKP